MSDWLPKFRPAWHGPGPSSVRELANVFRRKIRIRSRYHEPCLHCKKPFPRLKPRMPSQWCDECLGPGSAGDARLRGFNLSYPEWDMMKKLCGNKCEICGRDPWGVVRKGFVKKELTIDHDHETGSIRGLLCWQCNLDLERYLRIKDRINWYLEVAEMRGDPRGSNR